MKKRSVDLPPVAGRLEITSLLDYVDQSLEYLGPGPLDLGDPEKRERFRGWLHNFLSGYVQRLEWDLSKGASRGISQVLKVARDPDYYAKASERRKKRREEWLKDRTDRTATVSPPPEYMPMGIELPQADFGTYHVDLSEEPAFQIRLIDSASTQQEAERWIAEKFGPRANGERISLSGANRVELVHMTPTGEPVIIKTWSVG